MTDSHAEIHGEIYAESLDQHIEAVKLAEQLIALANDIAPPITMSSVANADSTSQAELLRKAAALLADRENRNKAIDSARYRHLRSMYGVETVHIAARYGYTELDRIVDFSAKGLVLIKNFVGKKPVILASAAI